MEPTFRDHIRYLWHFIKNREVCVFWCGERYKKFLGPSYVWYDGPHYGFGFWFFTVSAYYFREDEDQNARCRLIYLVEQLTSKDFGR